MLQRYKQSEIKKIATVLKNDGIISVPTDTVYGICARINSSKAYDKLVSVKNRPSNKPFPIMCSDIEQIKSIAVVNKREEKLIKAFMPGPITLILKKKISINNASLNECSSVAIRLATSDFLKELIDEVGTPLFMTSANKSGKNVCKNLEEIEKECPLIDGMVIGDVSFGEASTIVICTNDEIKIQRQGPIKEDGIMEVLNR